MLLHKVLHSVLFRGASYFISFLVTSTCKDEVAMPLAIERLILAAKRCSVAAPLIYSRSQVLEECMHSCSRPL